MFGSSVKKIASGLRVLQSSDDIASFSVAENLRSDTRVLEQASRNAEDGISLLKTAEGSINEISSIIIRLREVAAQAGTGTLGIDQRRSIQLEANALTDELDRIVATAEFGGQKLLNGALASNASNHITLSIGMDSSDDSLINLNKKVVLMIVF